MKNHEHKTPARRAWIGWLIVAVLLALLGSLFLPWNTASLASHAQPVQGYADALARIEALQACRAAEMDPVCQTQFLTHGQKTERAIVLVHGYTNCPAQYTQLGRQFHDLGYNVLIVPLPHHGLADKMTDEQSLLTAEEIAAYADEMVDIAHGLGEEVTMLGISAGGVTTAWAAQNRPDLELAVIISPAFGFKQIPTPLTTPVMNIFSILPESYEWWDPAVKENNLPLHAYPRYSKRGLAQTLRISAAVRAAAGSTAPGAQRILVITNASDTAVNNDLTALVVQAWQAHAANLTTYEFPADLQLGHDLIDPAQPTQRIDIVYPVLLELVAH